MNYKKSRAAKGMAVLLAVFLLLGMFPTAFASEAILEEPTAPFSEAATASSDVVSEISQEQPSSTENVTVADSISTAAFTASSDVSTEKPTDKNAPVSTELPVLAEPTPEDTSAPEAKIYRLEKHTTTTYPSVTTYKVLDEVAKELVLPYAKEGYLFVIKYGETWIGGGASSGPAMPELSVQMEVTDDKGTVLAENPDGADYTYTGSLMVDENTVESNFAPICFFPSRHQIPETMIAPRKLSLTLGLLKFSSGQQVFEKSVGLTIEQAPLREGTGSLFLSPANVTVVANQSTSEMDRKFDLKVYDPEGKLLAIENVTQSGVLGNVTTSYLGEEHYGVHAEVNLKGTQGTTVLKLDTKLGSAYASIRLFPEQGIFTKAEVYFSRAKDYMGRPYYKSLDLTESLERVSGGTEIGGIGTILTQMRKPNSEPFVLYAKGFSYFAAKDGASSMDNDAWVTMSRNTFATEFVESVTWHSSDPEILAVGEVVSTTTCLDPVAEQSEIYKNEAQKSFGVNLIPGSKEGKCTIWGEFVIRDKSLDEFLEPDTARCLKTVKIGVDYYISATGGGERVSADPSNLQAVLAQVVPDNTVPTVIELAGGNYDMNIATTKNVILKSADEQNPAVFRGQAGSLAPIIIMSTIISPNAELSGIVVDGGGTRIGIRNLGILTLRNVTVRQCTEGVQNNSSADKMGEYSLRSYNSRFEKNELAMGGNVPQYWLRNCTFTDNIAAIRDDSLGLNSAFGASSVHGCIFENNTSDVQETQWSTSTYNSFVVGSQFSQNYWGTGKTEPSFSTVTRVMEGNQPVYRPAQNPAEGYTAYSSPYYRDEQLTQMDITLDTTEKVNGVYQLAVWKGIGESKLSVGKSAFETLQGTNTAVDFPVLNEKGEQTANWRFDEVTNTKIDTALNVEPELSQKAQQQVDNLPASEQSKVMQEVNLSHNGQLPGRATISIKADQVPNGDVSTLKLYWVKPDGTIVPAEVVDVKYDETTKCFVITIDHCSEYIITRGEITFGGKEDEGGASGGSGNGNGSGGNESGSNGNNGGVDTVVPPTQPTVSPMQKRPSTSKKGSSSATPSATKLYSAEEIMSAFGSGNAIVSLKLGKKMHISEKAFELLQKNPEKALVLKGENYSWKFKGVDVVNPELAQGIFSARVDLIKEESMLAKIRKLAGEKAGFAAFETEFSGTLPGKAILTMVLPEVSNKTLWAYCLKEDGNIEFIEKTAADSEGNVPLTLAHCSTYFVSTVELEAEQSAAASSSASTPATNAVTPVVSEPTRQWWWPVGGLIALAVLVGLGYTLLGKRKK